MSEFAIDQNDEDRFSAHDQDIRPCGCPVDYHMADCPIITGGDGLSKEDYLEMYSRYDSMDDVPDGDQG